MKKLLAIGIVMALIILATGTNVAYANVRRTIPNEDPFLPQYSAAYYDGQIGWLAIVFYRQPSCVPSDINLRVYDLPLTYRGGAYQCPLAVSGFVIYEGEQGDPLDPAFWQNFPPKNPPKKYELHQASAVPIWFMTWDDFWAVYRNGPVTKSDLERMPSLRKGSANFYHETWHFPLGAQVETRSIEASGTFPDGLPVKSFQWHGSFQFPANQSYGHGSAHGAGGIVFK